jgi:hypothetical protein
MLTLVQEAARYLSAVDAFTEAGYDPFRAARRSQDYKALAEKVQREFEADVEAICARVEDLNL